MVRGIGVGGWENSKVRSAILLRVTSLTTDSFAGRNLDATSIRWQECWFKKRKKKKKKIIGTASSSFRHEYEDVVPWIFLAIFYTTIVNFKSDSGGF